MCCIVTGLSSVLKLVKLTIDANQREERGKSNEEKINNSCATKKNITGFYTEDGPCDLEKQRKLSFVVVPNKKVKLAFALRCFFFVPDLIWAFYPL